MMDRGGPSGRSGHARLFGQGAVIDHGAGESRADTPGPASGDLADAVAAMFAEQPVAGRDAAINLGDFLTVTIAAVLDRRGVQPGDICWPRFDILAPATEALRYAANRHAFAGLIAASMDTRQRDRVLPAYVEILKQLSEDEFEIMRRFPAKGRFTPVADVVYAFPNGQVLTAHRNVLGPEYASACATPANIPVYVDNLERLNIVARPAGQSAPPETYEGIVRQAFVGELFDAAPPHAMGNLEQALLGITDLGDAFRTCCF